MDRQEAVQKLATAGRLDGRSCGLRLAHAVWR